jgi:hypothetical protein
MEELDLLVYSGLRVVFKFVVVLVEADLGSGRRIEREIAVKELIEELRIIAAGLSGQIHGHE